MQELLLLTRNLQDKNNSLIHDVGLNGITETQQNVVILLTKDQKITVLLTANTAHTMSPL
jgi:hypothetical protein